MSQILPRDILTVKNVFIRHLVFLFANSGNPEIQRPVNHHPCPKVLTTTGDKLGINRSNEVFQVLDWESVLDMMVAGGKGGEGDDSGRPRSESLL